MHGDAGVRPRQPDVVVPVAAVRRGRAAGLAGGGRRPARDGVLAAGCAAHAGAAGGRSRRRARRAGRRRAGGGGGARLGRGGVAGLGGAAPRPAVGARAGQHGRAPAVGIVGARADPAGPDTGAAARGVRGDAGVRAGGDGAVASPAARGRARGVRGAVRVGAAAAGGRGVRRGHPARARRTSAPRPLDGIAEEVRKLDDVPVLLLWGPRDPVFSDRYLRDLRARLPHADVQRYEKASHLVLEDAPEAAGHAWAWITEHVPGRRGPDSDERHSRRTGSDDGAVRHEAGFEGPALWTALEERAGDPSPAVVSPGRGVRPRPNASPRVDGQVPRPHPSESGRAISWDLLVRRVHELAVGLADHGVAPGDRVALLVPPGPDLTAAAHACWRAGASVVVADPGLGAAGLARALRGAHPAHVVGALPGLALAAALGVPGSRIAAGPVPPGLRACSGRRSGWPRWPAAAGRCSTRGTPLPAEAGPDDEAAVLFTSGATGPAKGVVYRHRQAGAQLAALRGAYGITGDDRLVAAFPPFALYGPALGHRVGGPGGAQARRADRGRAGRRRRRGGRDDDLRLPRGAAHRRRHRVRARRGAARRPRRGPAGRLRGRAGARVAPARAARRAAAGDAAHAVRDDGGAARHGHRARRDRRGRPRERGVRRAAAARGGRRRGARCRWRRARGSPASPG